MQTLPLRALLNTKSSNIWMRSISCQGELQNHSSIARNNMLRSFDILHRDDGLWFQDMIPIFDEFNELEAVSFYINSHFL